MTKKTYTNSIGYLVRQLLLTTALATCYLLLPTVPLAHAQSSSIGISVSPPLSIAQSSGISPLNLAFTFKNESEQDMFITPRVRPFHADEVSGSPVIEDIDVPFVHIETQGFELGKPFPLRSGESQQIVLKFEPPKPFKRDGTFTLLGEAQTQSEFQIGGQVETKIRGIIGANMIIQAESGPSLPSAITIEEISGPSFVDVFSSLPVYLSAHNDDITLHQIRGTITLKYGDQVKDLMTIFPDFILSDSSRQVRAMITTEGQKHTAETLFNGPFLPGAYTIEMTLTQDNQDGLGKQAKPKIYTKTIYVIPFSIMSGALGLIAVLFLFTLIRKKRPIYP
jgi:hypothetical protein